jgi:hypothetical protein
LSFAAGGIERQREVGLKSLDSTVEQGRDSRALESIRELDLVGQLHASQSAKQTNFWDMAMALANELANFNIVVEKWDSSKIGGKRGSSKGKQGGAKDYNDTKGRAGLSNTRRAAAQEAASSFQDQVAGMPTAAQAALLQTLTAALSKSVVGQGWQALGNVQLIKRRTLACALSIRPSRHMMEASK